MHQRNDTRPFGQWAPYGRAAVRAPGDRPTEERELAAGTCTAVHVQLRVDLQIRYPLAYLAKGISKRSIAKLVECSPSTLYDWLTRRHIRTPRQAA